MRGAITKERTSGARVLVVDDDAGVRELVITALQGRGYVAEGAGDGLQALAHLEQGEFDVVVTDLEMPDLDGLGLLREIGRMEIPPTVVVLTGHADTTTEASLRQAGAFCVVRKGGRLRDLIRVVQKAGTRPKNPAAHCA